MHGKGYEFVADVRVVEGRSDSREGGDDHGDAFDEPARDLPIALQRLIGRDEILAALIEELDESRLITLVGSAGVGKTSLGMELARAVASHYADGVFVVELVTVDDRDAAFASVAGVLGVNTGLGLSIEDAIVDVLRARNTLLLLDNCEHLVEPIAELVERILRAAPRVRSWPPAANRWRSWANTYVRLRRCRSTTSIRRRSPTSQASRRWRCSSSGRKRPTRASS